MTPEEINSIIEIPEWDTFSAIKTEEAKFIYDFVKDNQIKKTLEIGFAFAKSAAHIIAASNSKHIACDPFQGNYNSMGLSNIEKLRFKELLEFYPDYSHNILPLLLKENRNFEFIFIDGDHKFDGIFIDFYYADLLLNKEGYILLHDTWMRSTRLVESFIKTNRKDYKHIKTPLRNFSLFQKVGSDNRNGMYFKEFYTFKSLVTHSIISWMSDGKRNFIKRMLSKIKDLIK
jgi:predicted O-methyltransferase YrrM